MKDSLDKALVAINRVVAAQNEVHAVQNVTGTTMMTGQSASTVGLSHAALKQANDDLLAATTEANVLIQAALDAGNTMEDIEKACGFKITED